MDLESLIRESLNEDIGPGDLTTQACVDPSIRGLATIVVKAPSIVVSGQRVAREVYRQISHRMDADVVYTVLVADGQEVPRGTIIAEVEGPLAVLLTGERCALNFLMKLCGIATQVRPWIKAAQDEDGKLGVRVVDTRKTTPLLRTLEKEAVRHGGAVNHRFGLYDGVMIKDNHIAAVGGITQAVTRARASVHHLVKIQVEVTNFDELREALAAGADVVMLDNMGDSDLAEAVRITRETRPDVVLEASGNMTPERIRGIRALGLDVVSAGGLIHQSTWIDLSMKLRALP